MPGSRRNPQYARTSLECELPPQGIGYIHLPRLGGLRRPRPESPNQGWRNLSFRGYADYMLEDAFWEEIESLIRLAGRQPTAIMCAEAVPWRCHRSLVADALTVRGVEVLHLGAGSRPRPHTLTPFAEVREGRLLYPGPPAAGRP